MTLALTQNNILLAVYDGSIPSGLLAPGLTVAGTPSVGWTSDDYAIIPASYTDTPPANSRQTGWTGEIVDGEARITRTWQEVTPPVPLDAPKLWLVRAMRALDWKTGFDAAMAQAPADMREDWDLCSSVRRDDAGVAAVAALMGKTTEDTDALFRKAQELQNS
jgi:hypothetical protein